MRVRSRAKRSGDTAFNFTDAFENSGTAEITLHQIRVPPSLLPQTQTDKSRTTRYPRATRSPARGEIFVDLGPIAIPSSVGATYPVGRKVSHLIATLFISLGRFHASHLSHSRKFQSVTDLFELSLQLSVANILVFLPHRAAGSPTNPQPSCLIVWQSTARSLSFPDASAGQS